MAQYCQNCGSRLNGGEAYCPRCQKPVANKNDTPAPSPQPTPTPSVAKGGMRKAISIAFKNYAVFSGRASRAEFWWFQLAVIVLVLLAFSPSFICLLIGLPLDSYRMGQAAGALAWIGFIASFVFMLPIWSCAARRLHDASYSGWFLLLQMIPFAGGIILLVMLLLPSQSGLNRFGPEPEPF